MNVGTLDIVIRSQNRSSAVLKKVTADTRNVSTATKKLTRDMTLQEAANKKLAASIKNKLLTAHLQGTSAAKTHATSLNKLLLSFTKVRWMLVNVAMVAGALYGAYKLLLEPTIQLETEMVTVRKRTKMTVDSIEELRKEIVNLSRSMPIAADKLAEIAGIAGQLGIRGKENILEFSKVVAMMGTATVLSGEEAALALAKLSAAFDIPIEQAENMASVINELSNTTAANSAEISSSLRRMAASAHQLGISFKVGAAISATLIDMGQKAERTGTRMRTAFTKMAIETEKIASLMRTVGNESEATARTIEQSIGQDADAVFVKIIGTLASITDGTQRVKLATEIFGRVGATAVNSLVSSYLTLQENIILASDEFEKATSLQDEYNIALQTTANQWTIYWGNIKAGITDAMSAENSWIGAHLQHINTLNQIQRGALKTVQLSPEATKKQQFTAEIYPYITPKNVEYIASMISLKISGKTKEEMLKSLSEVNAELEKQKRSVLTSEQETKFSKELIQLYEERNSLVDEYGIKSEQAAAKQLEIKDITEEIKNNYRDTNKFLDETIKKAAIKLGFTVSDEEKNKFKDLNYALNEYVTARKAVDDAETQGIQVQLDAAAGLEDVKIRIKESNDEYSNIITTLEKYYISTTKASDATSYAASEFQKLFMSTVELEKSKLDDKFLSIANALKEASDWTADNMRLLLAWLINEKNVVDETDILNTKIESINSSIDTWNNKIKNINNSLSEEKEELSDLNEELSNYNNGLSDLLSKRFTGQTDAEMAIYAIELAIKKEKLALLELEDATEGVDNSMNSMADKYKAWVDTIKTFIRETISAGEDLGQNVTSVVKSFQTKLLGLSLIDMEDEQMQQETAIDAMERELEMLRLKYDIAYGDMIQQVEWARIAHEEEQNAVATSANEIVSALQDKWNAISSVTEQIEIQENAVGVWEERLSSAREAVSDLKDEISDLKKELQDLQRSTGGGGSGSSSIPDDYYSSRAEFEAGGGTISGAQVGGLVTSSGVLSVHKGEVVKPANIVQPYTSTMESGKKIIIGDIHVNAGNATNSEEIARNIAHQIKSELSRI